MLFKKIPKELIIKIFSYDKTYHDNYKKCTKEIKNLIKCYPKKKLGIIHFNSKSKTISHAQYIIPDKYIYNYVQHCLYLLKKSKKPNTKTDDFI